MIRADWHHNIANTYLLNDASRALYGALPITERREGVMFVKTLTIVTCVFSAGVAVAIGVQLDQDHVSILSGFMIGAVLGAPVASIITYLALRRRQIEAITVSNRPNLPSTPALPPQVVYLPTPTAYQPMPPRATTTRQSEAWQSEPFVVPLRRKFYIIGDSGETSEIQADAERS